MRTTNKALILTTSSCQCVVVLVLLISVALEATVASAAQTSGSAAPTSQLESLKQNIEQSAPVAEDKISPQSDPDSGYAALRLEEERTRRYVVLGLIGACLASLVLVLTFLCRNNSCTTSALVNGSGLVLVIYATILVVVIARAEQQLTAAIGVLGAIIGYLFGSATRAGATEKQTAKNRALAEERSGAVS
jgi:hypothetical protein